MRHRGVQLANWIISRLASRDARDGLIGDLAEEYALRAKTSSGSAALGWYLRQACASIPHLAWMRLRRPGWLITLGVALGAHVAVGVAELVVNRVMAGVDADGNAVYNPLGLVVVFPIVVLIGYAAACVRRSAGTVLAVLMVFAVTVLVVSTNESMPLAFWVAYFLVGPSAALTGGALYSRSRRRSG